jgi:hypothetical protein
MGSTYKLLEANGMELILSEQSNRMSLDMYYVQTEGGKPFVEFSTGDQEMPVIADIIDKAAQAFSYWATNEQKADLLSRIQKHLR